MVTERAAKILELRKLIAEREGVQLRQRLFSSNIPGCIPKGANTEIAGTAKIEWVASFLKDNPTFKVFWVERKFLLSPVALHQRGVDCSRIIFAECGDEAFSTIRKALRCNVFECVIGPSIFYEIKLLKALQLLVEKVNASLILLTRELQTSWPISMQFEVNRAEDFHELKVKIKKNKGGHTNEAAGETLTHFEKKKELACSSN